MITDMYSQQYLTPTYTQQTQTRILHQEKVVEYLHFHITEVF